MLSIPVFDQIEGIAGDVSIRGHYNGDRMPDEVSAFARQNRVLRGFQIGNSGSAGDKAAFVVHVRPNAHQRDSRQCLRGTSFNPVYPRVRIRAAQDRGVKHAWQCDVVYVRPDAAYETRVFDALQGAADVRFGFESAHARR